MTAPKSTRYIGGGIILCIFFLIYTSFDISEYRNYHQTNDVTVSGEQQFISDVDLKTGPISEVWIQKMIDSATKRIWVGVYTFTLPDLREALLRAQRRGVDVQIIVEKNPFGNRTINRETLQFLAQNHIGYHESTAKQFSFMHAKYMLIDDHWIIETANWTRASFASNREFFMTGNDTSILRSLEDIFQKDFRGERGISGDIRLLAGPTNARERLINFLSTSQKSIDIYAPDFSDSGVITVLQKLCSERRNIRILLAQYPDEEKQKTDYGTCISVRYMKKPLHAKVLLRDKDKAFVGSFNYTKNSLEKNREIGLFLSGENVESISQVFESDWKQSGVALP